MSDQNTPEEIQKHTNESVKKSPKEVAQGCAIIIALVAVISILVWIFSDGDEPKQEIKESEKDASMLMPGKKGCKTVAGWFAAINQETFEKLTTYGRDGDNAAIAKLMKAKVVVQMRDSVDVFINDIHAFPSAVEIRIPGESEIYWTYPDAVKCP